MNTLKLDGIDFIEFANPAAAASANRKVDLENLFLAFGLSKIGRHQTLKVDYFKQNDIHFFLNNESTGFAAEFSNSHGPSICSMGWRFEDPQDAYQLALKRGAKPAKGQYKSESGDNLLAVYGIGESLIYFVSSQLHKMGYEEIGFKKASEPVLVPSKGFEAIDHLTNNVYKGTMGDWAKFYKDIFEFTEVRYFDIRGAKTGLTSYALRSPCGKFCIPINEGTEKKSQINEYLDEYRGPGVQHLAFLTKNILDSLKGLENEKIEMLDIDEDYYKDVFNRVPNVKENHKEIQKRNVLVDGDEKGYLLQIFTKNIIGPIFIEIIQRENNLSFGEGNFGALFKSIERDQMRRGFLS